MTSKDIQCVGALIARATSASENLTCDHASSSLSNKWRAYYEDLKARLYAIAYGRDTYNDVDLIEAENFAFAYLADAPCIYGFYSEEEQRVLDVATIVFLALEESGFAEGTIAAIQASYDGIDLLTEFDKLATRVPKKDIIPV